MSLKLKVELKSVIFSCRLKTSCIHCQTTARYRVESAVKKEKKDFRKSIRLPLLATSDLEAGLKGGMGGDGEGIYMTVASICVADGNYSGRPRRSSACNYCIAVSVITVRCAPCTRENCRRRRRRGRQP